MAFLSKLGGLRQSVIKHINPEASSPSIFQAIRCMSTSKLFIGGLSYTTDDQSLREAFGNYGEVVESRVIMDRETGRSRGFGFITYTSTEEASSAIQALDGQELHGRQVRVNYATDRARTGGFGGGGGYGGGGGGYGGGGGGYGGGGGGYSGGGGYGGGNYGSGGDSGSYGGNSGGYGGGNSFGSTGGDFGAPPAANDSFSTGAPGGGFGAADEFGGSAGGAAVTEGNFRDDDDDSDNLAKRA